MKIPVYKKRVIRRNNIRETVYVNCSSDNAKNPALIHLIYAGLTEIAPHSSFTIEGKHEDAEKMSRLERYNQTHWLLIFSFSECPCEFASESFPPKRIEPDEVLFAPDCKGMVMYNETDAVQKRYYLILEHNINLEMQFGLSEPKVFKADKPDLLMNLMKSLFDMTAASPRYTAMDFSVKLFEFLTFLCVPAQEDSPFLSSSEHLLQKVAKYPQNYPSMASLSRLFMVSETSLKSIFKRYTGLAPMTYVIKSRLENSCWQLKNTKMPIREIAELNGYRTEAFFSRSFKKYFGISPTGYRKREMPSCPAD